MAVSPITKRNARFQQWQALLSNRTKRHRAGAFLVQGVRPISLAVEHGWTIRSLLFAHGRRLSGWAGEMLERVDADRVALAPTLLGELGEKETEVPELVAVVELPPDRLERIPTGPDLLVALFDRPTSPGNVGSLVRSADAFGAHGVIVTGHAADPYDPKAVRASTGSLFAVPVVRLTGHRPVLEWAVSLRASGLPVSIVGTDEHGEVDIAEHSFAGPTIVAIGNETRGLSASWREACNRLVRIPVGGAASSLNAASAATIVLYEAARQRRAARQGTSGPPAV